MHPVVLRIRADLRQHIDPVYRDGSRAFFTEKIRNYGVRTPVVRKIARERYADVEGMEASKLYAVCEELLRHQLMEEQLIALAWVDRRRQEFGVKEFAVFERWLTRYVSNWAICDDFCGHALGHLLFAYPALWKRTKRWTTSRNRWLQRASVVSLIYSVRRHCAIPTVFAYCETLLTDSDDLVQKGYGWALKEISKVDAMPVWNFVMQHKDTMPRTALRYAVEKLPANLKRQAMKR